MNVINFEEEKYAKHLKKIDAALEFMIDKALKILIKIRNGEYKREDIDRLVNDQREICDKESRNMIILMQLSEYFEDVAEELRQNSCLSYGKLSMIMTEINREIIMALNEYEDYLEIDNFEKQER
jgi:hypothetical protein